MRPAFHMHSTNAPYTSHVYDDDGDDDGGGGGDDDDDGGGDDEDDDDDDYDVTAGSFLTLMSIQSNCIILSTFTVAFEDVTKCSNH